MSLSSLFSGSFFVRLLSNSCTAWCLQKLFRRGAALWAVFLTFWQASFLHRLGEQVFALCRRIWSGSGIVALFYREGFFARRWRSCALCGLANWIANLPGTLLHWLYRSALPLWEGSFCARLAFFLGDQIPVFAGLGIFFIMCIPYEFWDNANSLLLTAGLLLLFLAGAMRRKRQLDFTALNPYLLLFWGAVLLGAVFSDYRWLSLRFLKYHLPCVLLVLVFVSAVEHSRQLVQLAAGLGGGVLISGLYAIYQRVFVGISVNPSYVDVALNADMPGRVYSFYENPNAFAEVLMMLLPIVVALFFSLRRPGGKTASLGIFFLGLVAIVMTYSRASWVGLAVAALVYVFLWNRRLLPLCLLGVICAIPLLPSTVLNRILTITDSSDSSTSSRFPLWSAAIQMLKMQPIMGVGLGTDAVQARIREFALYDSVAAFVHAHNTFLQIWLETGLLGLVGFVGHVLWSIKATARAVWISENQVARHMAIGGSSALCGALVCGLADYLWNYPRVMFLFWTVCAITLGAIKLCRQENAG